MTQRHESIIFGPFNTMDVSLFSIQSDFRPTKMTKSIIEQLKMVRLSGFLIKGYVWWLKQYKLYSNSCGHGDENCYDYDSRSTTRDNFIFTKNLVKRKVKKFQ